jgi:predicted  nucleic acid-binding Zn-ribbon protein
VAFFSKRKLSRIESFESALKDKHVAREKLSDRLRAAEMALGEIRAAATRLAMAAAADAQLDWAEADMRAAEDRTKTLRTALAQLDEQIAATERELAAAKTQRDRE